jgi:CBS domain-containing protein
MQTQVVALRPEMSAQDAERLFAEHELTGAPVVDDTNRVLGVVSQSDLVRLDTAPPSTATAGAFFTDIASYADLGALPADESMVRVDALMSHRVLSVAPESPLTEAARLMREHRVHRLLVVDGDRLCGIVSALDLLIAIEEAATPK